MQAFVVGGYPRSPRVRKLLREYERSNVDDATLRRVVHEEEVFLLGYQLGAGLTILSDPVLEWHDILRPFATSWRGVAVDGLLRFFDNNFFYRVPIFVERPSPSQPVLAPRVRRLIEHVPSNAMLKVVVPGPVTFVKLSKLVEGLRFEDIVEDVARLLRDELAKAIDAGAKVVEIDEPWLCDVDAARSDGELVRELFNKYFADLPVLKILALYYAVPRKEVVEPLTDAKSDFVAVSIADDLRKGKELLANVCLEGVAVGAINARDIYIDKESDVETVIKEVVRQCSPKRIALTTSGWLDLIPYGYALEKTRILASIANRIQI